MHALQIRVLTYNIFHGESFYRRGEANLQAIAQVINDCQPDLVALQEVDRHTERSAALYDSQAQDLTQELARLTGMHGYFAKAMQQHNGDYGDAILSRSAASSTRAQILPAPEGGEPRALLVADIPFADGRSLSFAVTHLCHQQEANRLAQVQEIISQAEAAALPFLLAGDFNFEPDEAPYHVLAAALQDSGAAVGNTQLTWPVDAPIHRLDIVFHDRKHQWQVKEVRLIENDASDHFPVLVTLELK